MTLGAIASAERGPSRRHRSLGAHRCDALERHPHRHDGARQARPTPARYVRATGRARLREHRAVLLADDGTRTCPRLARRAQRRRSATPTSRSTRSACSAIRSRTARLDRETLRGWEALIDNAHLFGAKTIAGFTGRVRGKPIEASLPRYQRGLGRACQARRRQGRAHRVRELRDGRQLGDRRLEHRPQSRRLGADVRRAAATTISGSNGSPATSSST